MKRVESLDYLRGLMALAVMIYHYVAWTIGGLEADSVLGRLGIYAVSVFYILSGLSLAIVYNDRISSIGDVRDFMIKRVFRIFPLFWIAVTAGLVLKLAQALLAGEVFDFPLRTAVLSYTLLFGFIDPTAYLTTGAWSIGNEMVFYAILPMVFWLSVKSRIMLPLVIFVSLLMGAYFCYELFIPNKTLTEQWSTYINPFNQLFLFMAGVAIGAYGKRVERTLKLSKTVLLGLMLFCVLAFALTPAEGDRVTLVTEWRRIAFSLYCVLFVFALYVVNPVFHSLPARTLGFFGEGCYSIYLLHPIVAMPIVFMAAKLGVSKGGAYVIAAVVTLFVSWLTFRFVERPMMDVGKKVVNSLR